MPESGMYRALTPDERSRLEQQLAVAVELASGAARDAAIRKRIVSLLVWARYARVAGEHAYTLAHPQAAKPCRNVDVGGRAWKIVSGNLVDLAPSFTDWDTLAMYAGIPGATMAGRRPDLAAVKASIASAPRADVAYTEAVSSIRADPEAAEVAGDVLEAMAEAEEKPIHAEGSEKREMTIVLWEGAADTTRNRRIALVRSAYLEAGGNVRAALKALSENGHEVGKSTFYEYLRVLAREDRGWRHGVASGRPDSG